MRTNLSSLITLNRIPLKYYKPANAFERSVITRYEKFSTDIFESENEAACNVAREVAAAIQEKQNNGQQCVLALPGGYSPRAIYAELVRMHKEEGLSFKNVVVFIISEFYPLSDNPPHSNLKMVKEYLLDHIDIDPKHIFSQDGTIAKEDIAEHALQYEQKIGDFGGLDIALTGMGRLGNIGHNEPGSRLNSKTRLVLLDGESLKDTARFFSSIQNVPDCAITMGIATLMEAKKVILIAFGESKSKIVKQVVENPITDMAPASYFQNHNNAKVVLDLNSAEKLTRIRTPWLVTSCEWNDMMVRRAIVWLCEKTGKPILKLTNKDYNEFGLQELLALYGSAYNVNIKIFNDLQHTITGWPGGKPNEDDKYRPERATPYPKRVLVFSPHPDDDVISMGGTFRRLVDQNHDVYVAYETSGNIAVGDEEVIRSMSLYRSLIEKFDPQNTAMLEKYDSIVNYLLHEKKEGDMDPLDIRYIKGHLRREEARSACRFVGVKPENVNFLDLPFYETGAIKKGDLSEKDMLIVKDLLEKVQPHQIFVAGDLADPHGTHKVCLDAVLAAIDEAKGSEWLDNCRIWMYRGAWAEWEIENIEMAVPISPEELRQKRNAILRHQSQMESAPFLGNDERLFWQRAEERNRATADLYQQLGLASYEAIEAFVEYKPL
ncbi:MAG: glucosamine-6-phosphate deaminase [Bacteroidales bacterium]